MTEVSGCCRHLDSDCEQEWTADRHLVPRGLEELETITDTYVIPELKECEFRIACDVTNTLCVKQEQVLFTDRRKEQRHL